MKTPKLIKHGMLYSLLIGSLLIIGGCKKEKKQTDSLTTILGDWYEIPFNTNLSRTLHFSNDGTFVTRIVSFDTPRSVIKFSGTFKIKGDSLVVAIKEQSTEQGSNPSVTTPTYQKFYDKATFNLTDSILILNYTTYPADAPVATQTKFQKQLPD